MVSTAIAAEVTGAIRGLGTGMETQSRALGSSVRHLVLSAGANGSSRARIARQTHVPPAHVFVLIVDALDVVGSLLGSDRDYLEPAAGRIPGDFVVVARPLTRC